ncbi:hypothetical protein HDU76_007418 [Blyttiomyces sp. JEL0837]|nr:hypothetical protein HDU76_007418 [Blyttiomyces sp. JEL0837]
MLTYLNSSGPDVQFKSYGSANDALEETNRDAFDFTRNLTNLIRQQTSQKQQTLSGIIIEDPATPSDPTTIYPPPNIPTLQSSSTTTPKLDKTLQSKKTLQQTLGPLILSHPPITLENRNLPITIHSDLDGRYSILGCTKNISKLIKKPKLEVVNPRLEIRANLIYDIVVCPFGVLEVNEFLKERVEEFTYGGGAVVQVEDGGLVFTSWSPVPIYDFREIPAVLLEEEIPAGCLVDVHFMVYLYSGRLGANPEQGETGPVVGLHVYEVHLLEMCGQCREDKKKRGMKMLF